MKKRLFTILLTLMIVFIMMPSTIYADVGPKPSIVIEIRGLEDEDYYVTLLSETKSTGPYSVVDERPMSLDYQPEDEDYSIWEKFVAYESQEGYYFLQYFQNCSETDHFEWGYYPPSKFKILIYKPDNDTFIESDAIYERYAFDSYFIADVDHTIVNLSTNYDYANEIGSLVIRIVLTLGIEMLIALAFGLKYKQILKYIFVVNVITQVLLNILLNISNFMYGAMLFVMGYVLLEILIIIIEGVLYTRYINHVNRHLNIRKWVAPVYAIIANIASFVIGMIVAIRFESIF